MFLKYNLHWKEVFQLFWVSWLLTDCHILQGHSTWPIAPVASFLGTSLVNKILNPFFLLAVALNCLVKCWGHLSIGWCNSRKSSLHASFVG